ncbi:MAG: hypothetical protein JSV96_17385 [Candidatus Aminicenantes bacterium]|nr:MAG: hypothetical protein JSV96_17385 [Candidatus Aminicenantes bacterium]
MRKTKALLFIFSLFFMVGASLAEESDEQILVSSSQALKLGAYTQVRYTHWEGGHDGFRIKRTRVGLKGEIVKNINFSLQIDATKSTILLDSRVGISFSPESELAFGQFKVPFSLENLTSTSLLDTINRSQTVEKLCPGRDIGSGGRDIGVTFSGKYSRAEYTVGIFNGSGINKYDDNDEKDVALRLVLYPVSSVGVGISYYDGKYSSDSGASPERRDRTGVDIYFTEGPLTVKGEYIFARDGRIDRNGWYVQGNYYLIQEKTQAIIKYDVLDRNRDIQGDRLEVITLGLNWFFYKKTKFQINYEYHKEGLTKSNESVILAQFQAGF